ncbi:MAG: hypothetical protein KBT29_11085 [Prevotellaceae bacterium]|nr:hypothetical protein [Candidatus Minthosoma caballi]
MKNRTILFAAFVSWLIMANNRLNAQTLKEGEMPALPPFPEIPEKKPVGSVKLGDINTFAEVKLGIPITDGPFKPTWESIEANYPGDAE